MKLSLIKDWLTVSFFLAALLTSGCAQHEKSASVPSALPHISGVDAGGFDEVRPEVKLPTESRDE